MIDLMNRLLQDNISLAVQATTFAINKPIAQATNPLDQSRGRLDLEHAAWAYSASSSQAGDTIDYTVQFRLSEGSVACGNVSVTLSFAHWSTDNYVLMPAAAYNGNRFRVVKKKYPPFLQDEDGIGVDMPVTITHVPHLNSEDGPSSIHLRSGDLATPAVGIFNPEKQRGFLLFFEPINAFGYTGIRLQESLDRSTATLTIEAPAVREKLYTMMDASRPSDDQGCSFVAGDVLQIKMRLLLFDCRSIPDLYDVFFCHRKDLVGGSTLHHDLPWSAAYRIIEDKYNQTQYSEQYDYYRLSPHGEGGMYGDWQSGWCGGGLNSLALAYDGSKLSKVRANRTMDSIFGYLQNKNGYILPSMHDGQPFGDDFQNKHLQHVLLVRKNGDVLLFAARHIDLMRQRGETVPASWIAGLARLADAFVRLWEQYHQFGQFIDIETETILQGGTASGSSVPGGLIMAWRILSDKRYRDVAEASAHDYYEKHVCQGLMNGGPGEILQNADSESASNLLESFVTLYDVTGDRQWLTMAEQTAHQCASWIVSYDFVFPAQSSFGQLGLHTLGSVYANVQNKHSAPGFCTLSGASLLRLARATGNRAYLDLIRETAHNITQYVSRADRPIASWDQSKPLPPGWMCERVNMSDWEGKDKIGGVFYGSCWCEVSCLLTYAEIPGIWFFTDSGEAFILDHVEVSVTDDDAYWQLNITNPTRFDAEIKLLAESHADLATPWDPCVTDHCQVVAVKAGALSTFKVKKAASLQQKASTAHLDLDLDLSYNP